jgi:hypothetical protein
MKILTIDVETFFSDTFTLKKETTESYCRSEQFEVHGWAVKEEDQPAVWHDHKSACEYFECVDWPNTAVIAHHAHFDLFILNHTYGFKPGMIICTLSMGRVVFDAGVKLGLGDLAGRFGLAEKNVPYDHFRGKHWSELAEPVRRDVAGGSMHDVELTWQIANYMLSGGHPAVPYLFPASELPVVDATIRMFTEPTLVGDIELLGAAWTAEEEARQDLFQRLRTSAQELRKDAQFAQMLEELGVEPALKTTAKGNEKYAFAKSDFFMQDLVGSEDPDVALLAEARLKAQSSIYSTRIERIGFAATRGPLPIYLTYAGAHTRRWSGGDKSNYQNLPRPDPAKPQKGALRRAIKTP